MTEQVTDEAPPSSPPPSLSEPVGNDTLDQEALLTKLAEQNRWSSNNNVAVTMCYMQAWHHVHVVASLNNFLPVLVPAIKTVCRAGLGVGGAIGYSHANIDTKGFWSFIIV